MNELLMSGIIFGFANGTSPGPLSNLIISNTIDHGKKEGIKIALSPFISDLFIVSLAFFIHTNSLEIKMINSILPILGALFLVYIGIQGLKTSTSVDSKNNQTTLVQAVLMNLFNPYPYLFWILVGVPLVLSIQDGLIAQLLFFILFYGFFMISKLGIIFAVDKGLKSRSVTIKNNINKLLSLSMFYFAFKLVLLGVNS
jgi:threonine/homoserine/homoserine lactone efflux protein